jgi:hypothetical protein
LPKITDDYICFENRNFRGWKRTGSALVTDRQTIEITTEPARFRLASMTVQSSFLIRCSLNTSGDLTSGKAYYIQHVQSGAEFRAATLAEVTHWAGDQNLRYLAATTDTASRAQEDLQ